MHEDGVAIFFADGGDLVGVCHPSDTAGKWDYFFTPEAWAQIKGVPCRFRLCGMTSSVCAEFLGKLRGRTPVVCIQDPPPLPFEN